MSKTSNTPSVLLKLGHGGLTEAAEQPNGGRDACPYPTLANAAGGESLSGFPHRRDLRPRGSILKSLGLRCVLGAQVPSASTPTSRLLAVADRIAGRSALSDKPGGFVTSLPAVSFEIRAYLHRLPPTLGTLTRSWSHRSAWMSRKQFAWSANGL